MRVKEERYNDDGKIVRIRDLSLHICNNEDPMLLEIDLVDPAKTLHTSILIPVNELLYRLEQRGVIIREKS